MVAPPYTRSCSAPLNHTPMIPSLRYPCPFKLRLCRARYLALRLLLAHPHPTLLILALIPQPTLRQEAAITTRWNEALLLQLFKATPRYFPRYESKFELAFTARHGPTKLAVVKGAVLRISYGGITWTLYELHHPERELYTLVKRMSLLHWLALMVFGVKVADVGLLELHRKEGVVDGFWWQCEVEREREYFKRCETGKKRCRKCGRKGRGDVCRGRREKRKVYDGEDGEGGGCRGRKAKREVCGGEMKALEL